MARLAMSVHARDILPAPAVRAALDAIADAVDRLGPSPSSAAVQRTIADAPCPDIVVAARGGIPAA